MKCNAFAHKVLDSIRQILAIAPLSSLNSSRQNQDVKAHPERLTLLLRRLILARVIVLSILLGASFWHIFFSGAQRVNLIALSWIFALLFAVSLLNAWWLDYTKRPMLMGNFQLLTDALFATGVLYVTGSTSAISLYLLVIVAAAVVTGRQGSIVFAAVCGLCYAILASGLVPSMGDISFSAQTPDILGVYLSLITIAVLSGYLANQVDRMGFIADRNAQDLSDLSEKQTQLFNDISEGVITLNLEQAISGINDAARSLMGLQDIPLEGVIGRPLGNVLNDHSFSATNDLLSATSRTSEVIEIAFPPNDVGDEERFLQCSVKTLTNPDGADSGKMILLNDVSSIKGMQEQLELHERMVKMLAESNITEQTAGRRLSGVDIIGDSDAMAEVFSMTNRIAQSDASVLVTGESGTGKELFARAIHTKGPRKLKPFVAINCGAIPSELMESEFFGHKKGAFTGAVQDSLGLFREAQLGTIFLDEIGELPLILQTKLLRVLQEKTVRAVGDTKDTVVDVRVIAATNRDLRKLIDEGKFREDLYYRLNVVHISVPPLRERRSDIPLLVRHFLSKLSPHSSQPQISPEALRVLTSYTYPGNIRELENIIERAIVLGGSAILPEHLPDEVVNARQSITKPSAPSAEADPAQKSVTFPINLEAELEELERHYLHAALAQCDGVKKAAAELLGLNFRSFRYRLKKYELSENQSQSTADNS